MTPTFKTQLLRLAVHIGSFIPVLALGWDLLNNPRIADPIRHSLLWTGKTALTLLILSLACTPVNILFRYNPALKVRRALGLYAFAYATLHFLLFIGIDYGFDVTLLGDAVFKQPYVVVGFTAFIILVPIAITSTKGWMKRLGQLWTKLHRWVYLAALLVIVHFVWLVKVDTREPLTYGAILVALLALRLPPIRRAISQARQRLQTRLAS